jgi:hypothetical protein
MNRPYEYTLTQADRIVFQKWLLGTSAFWGLATLLIVVSAIASHDGRTTVQNETAAGVRSGTQDKPVCPDRKRHTRLLRKQTGTDNEVFLGCV